MSRQLTISQEILQIGGKHSLGENLLAQVAATRKQITTRRIYQDGDFKAIAELIHAETGMTLYVEAVHKNDPFAFSFYSLVYPGHQGSAARYYFDHGRTVIHGTEKNTDEILAGTIDLEKVRVTGVLSEIPFMLCLPVMAFMDSTLTNEEITAAILHEVGHGFTLLATLGEYVWLNYYLTEGIDVLLGKKPNKYRCELLVQTYLEKQVDPELRKKLQREPTEANLRRAILTTVGQNPRNHLTANVVKGALKRDEQLADWFATRLGFGRPLATLLSRISGAARMSRGEHLFKETMKVLGCATLGVITASIPNPITALLFAASIMLTLSESYSPRHHDTMTERIQKVRRDLIAQLKHPATTPAMKKVLLEDLKVVEEAAKGVSEYETTGDLIKYALIPGYRRNTQRLKAEEELEKLLNHDLSILAARYKNH